MRDVNGQALAYVYSRETEAEARQAKVLTSDEARRIAINIARLHELLGKGEAAGLSGAAMTTKGPHRSGAKSREPIVMRANARSLMVTSERFTKGLDEIRILTRRRRPQSVQIGIARLPELLGKASASEQWLR